MKRSLLQLVLLDQKIYKNALKLEFFEKTALYKNHNYQKYEKRSLCLNLSDIQSDLCARHLCPQQPVLHGNRIRSPILSRETRGECAGHLVTNSLYELK